MPAAYRAGRAVEVSQRIVVTGGRLKKPWVPQPLLDRDGQLVIAQGKQFLALSTSDYKLGQFLYGKTNGKPSELFQGRNFANSQIVRRLWKERNRLQEEQYREKFGDSSLQDVEDADAALVDSLFTNDGAGGEQAAPSQSEKRDSRRFRQLVLDKDAFHPFCNVCVPSAKDGQATVSFVVARAVPERLVAIELSNESLQKLFDEIDAELAMGLAVPITPPRRGKRRLHPFARSPGVRSPGVASSPSAAQKKERRSGSYFDKKKMIHF